MPYRQDRNPQPRARLRAARRQRGMSLIEILVAIVLLSVGLLGLAGLQLRGMQVNQGSAMRSQAAIMAEDLADRMRADVAAANPANTAGGFYGAFTPSNAATAATPALQDWLAGLAALPGGVSTVAEPCGTALPCVNIVALPTAPATVPTPVKIEVYWNDMRASKGAGETNQLGTYAMVAELSDAY